MTVPTQEFESGGLRFLKVFAGMLGIQLGDRFAEGLSEEEWHAPVSATDRRSVGLIVHHVASMYPIEIDVARAIANGQAVTDVTWDVRGCFSLLSRYNLLSALCRG